MSSVTVVMEGGNVEVLEDVIEVSLLDDFFVILTKSGTIYIHNKTVLTLAESTYAQVS